MLSDRATSAIGRPDVLTNSKASRRNWSGYLFGRPMMGSFLHGIPRNQVSKKPGHHQKSHQLDAINADNSNSEKHILRRPRSRRSLKSSGHFPTQLRAESEKAHREVEAISLKWLARSHHLLRIYVNRWQRRTIGAVDGQLRKHAVRSVYTGA